MKSLRNFTIFAVIALISFSWVTAQRGQADMNKIRQEIEAANTKFIEALKRSDAAAIAAMYADNAVVMPPNSEMVRGRQAIQQLWQGFLGMGIKDAVLQTVEVRGGRNQVYEIGAYTMTLQSQGQNEIKDSGKYLVVWRRQQDGPWMLHVDIWNSSLPAAK